LGNLAGSSKSLVDRYRILLGQYDGMRGSVMETLSLLEVERQARHQRWIKGWYDGLAYCNMCQHEYTKDERLKNMQDELLCPKCLKPEDKSYYYCEDHGQSQCKECDHNV